MTSSQSADREAAMHAEARTLHEKYTSPKLYEDGFALKTGWYELEKMTPKTGVTGYFNPDSSLEFLGDLVGRKVSRVSNISIDGISYKTHLNIQGRIVAGEAYLALDLTSQRNAVGWCAGSGFENEFAKHNEKIETYVKTLKAFEKDFSDFLERHKELIIDGLAERRLSAQGTTVHLTPQELWVKGSTYDVPDELLPFARFSGGEDEARRAELTNFDIVTALSTPKIPFLDRVSNRVPFKKYLQRGLHS